MRRTIPRWSAAPLAAALATVLLTAGCGDVEVTAKDDGTKGPDQATTTAPATDTAVGRGDWLLGVTSAVGDDAESSKTAYITYNPSTGVASKHEIPAVQAPSATPEQAALLVSANRSWAIPDTGISRGEEKSGQLKVYSLETGAPKVIDIRERTGRDDVDAIGWAFDPERADTLRVVDGKNRVWAVNVAGGKATQESTLPKGPWVFTNGFNANSGEPWVESIDSDATKPAGNGPADTTPVSRGGGTVLPGGSPGFAKLPASPCRLGAGFTTPSGTTWAFCADEPSLKTYYLAKDAGEWTAYGKPSTAVSPEAAGFPLVLPPTE